MNKYLVSANVRGQVFIQNPPMVGMGADEALEFAAWIVLLSEHNANQTFAEILSEVSNG